MIDDFLNNVPVPRMATVRQHFSRPRIPDVGGAVRAALLQCPALAAIGQGRRVAITAGSRGISHIVDVLQSVVEVMKALGAEPFIVPAMGSHGGATGEGQLAVLASLGITEKSTGAPIRSSMETVTVGVTKDGLPVCMDRLAATCADATIVVNRVKPHTSFRGRYESGLAKMIAIGLGKQQGAAACHATGLGKMSARIEKIARIALSNGNIAIGIALVENAYDETCHVEALPAADILDNEPRLLKLANANMPTILLPHYDVLIVDEMGKNISGTGMDANVIGRFTSGEIPDRHSMQRIAILDLTEESHGNGHGMGLADVCTRRLFDKLDLEQTYPNPLTARVPLSAKIPMIMKNDLRAIQAAIATCWDIQAKDVRMVRIKNTRDIEDIQVSESLLDEVNDHLHMKVVEAAAPLRFDGTGNLSGAVGDFHK